MKQNTKPSVWLIIVCTLLSLLITAAGIYALIEKKMIISGKYSGDLYRLSDIESILIALSFFMVAAFILLILSEKKAVKLTGQWLFGLGIILFLASSFV